MNFYKHFLGDYARDTADLSLLEHGAYRVMLDHYYAQRGDMPADLTKLERVCKARTTVERQAVQEVANRFFPINGDGRRHNKRADEEIQRHVGQVEHNRIVGALGGRPRKKPGNNPGGNPEETRVVSKTEPGNNPSHSQKPERTKASPANAGEGRDDVATVPDCPHEKLIALYHELLPTCTQVVEWNDQRKAIARARWREKGAAKPGYRTVEDGLAYWRRFFEYVAGSKFLTGKAEPGRDRKPFVATLEWLLRPKNFAKVVEGTYHT
jgi:uncharacterized protein YdaU (DUF1376 family)